MASTEAGLCNIALARIGHRNFIGSLVEASAESRVCAALYPDARDAVLASFAWPFAKRREELAVIVDGEQSGWYYAYSLPANCIAPLYLYPGTRNPGSEERIPFALEANSSGVEYLLTDLEDAELVYTVRIADVPRFSPLFVDALAWKMASDLALALPVKPQVAGMMLQGYERAVSRAAAAELNKQQGDLPPLSEFIRAR